MATQIRLPQLKADSLPDNQSSAFAIGVAGETALLKFDTSNSAEKMEMAGHLEMKSKNIELFDGDTSKMLLSSDGSLRLGTSGSPIFQISNAGSITAEDMVIKGNLTVQGSTTTVESSIVTIKDKSLVVASDGVKQASFALSSNVLTVSLASHGFADSEYVYLQSNNVKEGIYQVTDGNSNANQFTVSLTQSDFTSQDGYVGVNNIVDSNSDGAGYLIPTVAGLIGISYDDTNEQEALVIDAGTQASISMKGNTYFANSVELGGASSETISFVGTVKHNTGNFMVVDTAGTNDITLAVASASSPETITFPAASGTVAVKVQNNAGASQAAADQGIQLSTSGELAINIGGTAQITDQALASSDMFLVEDNDASAGQKNKRLSVADLQAFLSSAGTVKSYGSSLSGAATTEIDVSGVSNIGNWVGRSSAAARELYLNGVLLREGSGQDFEITNSGNGTEGITFSFDVVSADLLTFVYRA